MADRLWTAERHCETGACHVDLYQRLGIENVADVVRRERLRWFGIEHVERRDKEQ